MYYIQKVKQYSVERSQDQDVILSVRSWKHCCMSWVTIKMPMRRIFYSWVLEMTLELCEYNKKNLWMWTLKCWHLWSSRPQVMKPIHIFCSTYLVSNFPLSLYLLPIDSDALRPHQRSSFVQRKVLTGETRNWSKCREYMSVECSPTIGTTLFTPKLRTFMD